MSGAWTLPADKFVPFGPLMNKPLTGARADGCENRVVHRMQEDALSQIIFRCHQEGIDPMVLSPRETHELMQNIWNGMLNPEAPGQAVISDYGFDSLYERLRAEMQREGLRMAEHVLEDALTAMRILAEKAQGADRKTASALQKGFIAAGREAASAARVVGEDAAAVLEQFRADVRLRTFAANWLPVLEEAVHRDNEIANGAIPEIMESKPRNLLRSLIGRPA